MADCIFLQNYMLSALLFSGGAFMIEAIVNVNNAVNGVVWGTFGIALLLAAGIVMTVINLGFQFKHISHWIEKTIGAIFTDKHITAHTAKENKAISQFQSLCTAMAATIGTGNIVGVATAITLGGPGAIFWMWVMAFVGMKTNYSENVLGIYFRQKGKSGEWRGGAMYYLREGLGSYKGMKIVGVVLSVLFSVFCLMASFGIGNMSQVNSISSNMQSAFNIPTWVTGIALMAIAAVVVLGGLKRVAIVTEKLVPFMAIVYILAALIVVIVNIKHVGPAIGSIFGEAFTPRAVIGGGIGTTIRMGIARGVFSNEAGLGSAPIAHAATSETNPVRQGLFGIFEVFMDTIVICTLTALSVLVGTHNGAIATEYGSKAGVGEVVASFSGVFGSQIGSLIIAVGIGCCAFSTVLGWSLYGIRCFEYIFGTKASMGYKWVFVFVILLGATLTLEAVWGIADTLNGLMAIPNLIAIFALSPVVIKLTKDFFGDKKNIE